MLQAIREKAQGWIAWVIVILISIPFALWGIQEYLGVGSEPVAATVNGQDITERELDARFQRFRMELRERLGNAYRPELFDDAKLRREVLDDMIRANIVLQASTDMGLRAGDAQVQSAILAEPAFQKGGQFDKTSYDLQLRYQGLTSQQFEQRVRASLMASQLSQVVAASEILTEREFTELVGLRRQQRDFSYVLLPLAGFQDEGEVTAEAIAAYYQAHGADFRTPEQVKLDYLVLDRADLVSSQEVDEQVLRRLYEEKKAEFATPESRRARHILINADMAAEQAHQDEARAKAEDLRKRILAGEDFAVLAKEFSQDPGSASMGGDLGFFERGLMDPEFDKVVFSLTPGTLSELVRTRFGYHLIEVTEIKSEVVKPFAEVKERLLSLQQGSESQQRYYDHVERLGNLSYEHPDSLLPAAESLGLKVRTSDWLDRGGSGDPLLSYPKVLEAAFSSEVLTQGNNSELIEIEDQGAQKAVVVRVVEHREAQQRALEEVREQIIAAIREDKARQAASQKADELLQRLRNGEPLEQVAKGYEIKQPGFMGRLAEEVPGAILETVFTLPAPTETGSSFGSTRLPDGAMALIRLVAVKEGSLEGLTDQEKDMQRQALLNSLARNYYAHLVADLQQRAKVHVSLKPRALE